MKYPYTFGVGRRTLRAEDHGLILRIIGKCAFTGKEHSVVVPKKAFERWRRERQHIQLALPTISADAREFLISAISPQGWDEVMCDPDVVVGRGVRYYGRR